MKLESQYPTCQIHLKGTKYIIWNQYCNSNFDADSKNNNFLCYYITFRELHKRRQHAIMLARGDSSICRPNVAGAPPTKSMSMTNLSSGPSGSSLGAQRTPRNSGVIDNSDNVSVLSSATSIGSIGSINSIGGSKKRRAPPAPAAHQKRPLASNSIPEETPSLLRTEEEVFINV